MNIKELYRKILNEHTVSPIYKRIMSGAQLKMHGVNPSCGDNITLYLDIKDGLIASGSFDGSGCAISQASVDMMLDLIIGKTKEEALRLADLFERMIVGSASEEEIEDLEESSALKDISKMPARVKCAELGWRTMKQMLTQGGNASQIKATAQIPDSDHMPNC